MAHRLSRIGFWFCCKLSNLWISDFTPRKCKIFGFWKSFWVMWFRIKNKLYAEILHVVSIRMMKPIRLNFFWNFPLFGTAPIYKISIDFDYLIAHVSLSRALIFDAESHDLKRFSKIENSRSKVGNLPMVDTSLKTFKSLASYLSTKGPNGTTIKNKNLQYTNFRWRKNMQEPVEITSSIINEKILISLFFIVSEGKCSNHTVWFIHPVMKIRKINSCFY